MKRREFIDCIRPEGACVFWSSQKCACCLDNIHNTTLESKPKQVGGKHYQGAIQPIDFIVKNNIPYREANVIKYVFRHKKKNGVEDINKAIHYLEMIKGDYSA